jgi:hypothetical protein
MIYTIWLHRDPEWAATITDEHCPTLINMLQSGYSDVQHEGLKTLAQLSQTAANARVMLNNRTLVEEVVRHLSSTHMVCQTQAAKLIGNISSNMSGNTEMQDQCLQAALPPLISALFVAPTTVGVVEFQRQCCLALSALANVYATEIVQGRGREALQHHLRANDAVMAKRAQAAMDGLSMVAITAF